MPPPAAGMGTPVVSSPVAAAPPSREELLDRLRAKRISLRNPGCQPKQVKSKKKTKNTIERMANDVLTDDEARKRAELEKLMEECNGDINMFCRRSGINQSFVPAIKNAVKAIGEGCDAKDAIATAATAVLDAARKMKAKA